jgi:hypothetical protein
MTAARRHGRSNLFAPLRRPLRQATCSKLTYEPLDLLPSRPPPARYCTVSVLPSPLFVADLFWLTAGTSCRSAYMPLGSLSDVPKSKQ